MESINWYRGQALAYDAVLELCDTLDKYKVATEADKKRLDLINRTEPFQAIVEGKTNFTKSDLGLE